MRATTGMTLVEVVIATLVLAMILLGSRRDANIFRFLPCSAPSAGVCAKRGHQFSAA